MNLLHWPWSMLRGKRSAARRTESPRVRLGVEQLEARALMSAAPLATATSADWRQQRFTVDDVVVANQVGPQPLAASAAGAPVNTSFGSLIGLDKVFANYSYRGTGYSVAVIDTGIDYNDADLGGGWGKRVIAGYDFANNDADPMDDNGHGTFVAGEIGGSSAMYSGIAPNINLIALKVLDAQGSGSYGNVDLALQWVAAHQAQYNIVAINMSLGSGNYQTNPYAVLDSDFTMLKSKGVFIAVASGNDFYTYGSKQGLAFPAISTSVVSVGAVWAGNFGNVGWVSGARDNTTATDRIASFTQRGPGLDILAPGAILTGDYLHGSYVTMAGTSMASPIIAGAAALLHQALDAQGESSLANQDYILKLLQNTGKSVIDGDDENDNVINTGLTFKRLDLKAAVDATAATTNHAPTLAAIGNVNMSTSQNSTTVVLAGSDADGNALTYSALAQGSSAAFDLQQQLGLSYAGDYFTNSWGQNEKWLLGSAGQWYIIIPSGMLYRWADTMAATLTAANLAATLDSSFYADPSKLWNASPASSPPVTLSLVGNQLTIDPATGYTGTFTIVASVSDGTLSASQSFTVTVTNGAANHAPVIAAIANQTMHAGQGSFTLTLPVSDADNDPLTDSARVTTIGVSATLHLVGNQLTVTPAAGFLGNLTIEVSTSDGQASATGTFILSVLNSAPVIGALPNVTMSVNQHNLAVTLPLSDADGDHLNVTASIQVANPIYSLKTGLGLYYLGGYFQNSTHQNEKWLAGANGRFYWLLPNGQLRRWAGTVAATLAPINLIATVGRNYYYDPSLLWNASPTSSSPATVTVSGNQLVIDPAAGYRGTFTVQVLVSDGLVSVKKTFSVTVA